MQIFWTDNYARETVSERVVATGIQNNHELEVMLKALRDWAGPESWYRPAGDDEKPYIFNPNG